MKGLKTSNVFRLIRYIPIKHGLLVILTKAENVEDNDVLSGEKPYLPDNINKAIYHFWKQFDNCKPAIFIELMQITAKQLQVESREKSKNEKVPPVLRIWKTIEIKSGIFRSTIDAKKLFVK